MGAAQRVGAQVDCVDPNNLCSGDPCVINAIEVVSPCVVDFGGRTVIVRGTIRVPNAGILDMTAGDIQVRNGVFGRHLTPGSGDGATVTLTATTGDILVKGTIDVSARNAPGAIHLVSVNGNIDIERKLRAVAAGGGAAASGGQVSLEAAMGAITTDGQGQIDTRGANFGKDTPGGQVDFTGGSIVIDTKIRTGGSDGGDVSIVSNNGGSIDLTDGISTRAKLGSGGDLSISTAGTLNMRKARLDGVTAAGNANISVGSANVQGGIRARSKAAGATIVVNSVGDAAIAGGFDVRARTTGGSIQITSSAGKIDSHAKLSVRADAAGDIFVVASGPLIFVKDADARGSTTGGMITVAGATVALSPGKFSVRGDTAGSISVSGGSVTSERSTRMDARGRAAGGEIRFASLSGDLTMSGGYSALGAGPAPNSVVAGSSAGNLTTPDGNFSADPTGCLGFSAAGTLDLSGGTFAGPAVTPTCASPSGAYLDGFATF